MPYRIEYDKSNQKYEIRNQNTYRFHLILLASYIVFFILTSTFWPEGRALIQELMIPGDNAVTSEAFSTMTRELRSGASFNDAIYTFCYEIIDDAKNPG